MVIFRLGEWPFVGIGQAVSRLQSGCMAWALRGSSGPGLVPHSSRPQGESDLTELTWHIVESCIIMYLPILFVYMLFVHRAKEHIIVGRDSVQKPGRNLIRVGVICATWCVTSVGMQSSNKALVMVVGAPTSIACMQMFIAVVLIAAAFGVKVFPNIIGMPQQARAWLIVSFTFTTVLVSSIFTFKYITLSAMTLVRTISPLVALPIEIAIMPSERQPKVNLLCALAMALMIAGGAIYASATPNFSKVGLGYATLNTVFAVIDRFVQRRLMIKECQDLTLETCTFICNLAGMAMTLVIVVMQGELKVLASNPRLFQLDVVMLLIVSGVLGWGMCYSGLALQRAVTTTTSLMVQNVSRIAVAAVGVWLFQDIITSRTFVGLMCTICASFIYGISQLDRGPKWLDNVQRGAKRGS
eukprot:TRINITY_DN12402_c0_g1_i1.p1 TRINITY_DN12402_c0_g1~~TRINITY_DN12402_c0_g1_i1.p1  ORF type:complete len:413 (+),score=60.34 TRINITY_DN12402_c0_g1_i1:13-1251(+)